MSKIITVVGARPNFMKAAALHRALLGTGRIDSKIVHTGQHYDPVMSDIFFRELDLPTPDEHLGISHKRPNQLIARIMLALEPVLEREKPDWVVVIGDVNSTLAAALTAHKMGIPLAHVEAGLRSFDRTMPEENNRILTDALSDLLFVTEAVGLENIHNEGLAGKKVHEVGNCLVDALLQCREKAAQTRQYEQWRLPERGYALLTFHRPANVDTEAALAKLVALVETVCQRFPAVFPLHPRSRRALEQSGLLPRLESNPRLRLVEPLGYLPFLNLLEHAALVISDSGGVQVESTCLNVPCITFRTTSESRVCIGQGTNVLLPDPDPAQLHALLDMIQAGRWKKSRLPDLWDGHAGERMAEILCA